MTWSMMSPLIGKQVKGVTRDGDSRLTMTFAGGTLLVVGIRRGTLTADLTHESAPPRSATDAPTTRQLEYLIFIAKYIRRYGRAPAESDIARHVLARLYC